MDRRIERKREAALINLSDGAAIALRRWGEPRAKRMVISHGNGLAIDGFRAFGAALAAEFEVIAFDMRNHGQSGPGPVLDAPWPRLIKDIPEIFDAIQDRFGEKPTHGAFHSLSSACALMAQGQDRRPWRSLSLYEPPIPPATNKDLMRRYLELHRGLAKRARKRRVRFTGPDQLLRSFTRSPACGAIPKDVLACLALAVMRKTGADPDFPWELICPAEMEANIFELHRINASWRDTACFEMPVQVILGTVPGHDMPILVEIGRELARSFGFRTASVDGGGHLMQLQHPKQSAEHAIRFANETL